MIRDDDDVRVAPDIVGENKCCNNLWLMIPVHSKLLHIHSEFDARTFLIWYSYIFILLLIHFNFDAHTFCSYFMQIIEKWNFYFYIEHNLIEIFFFAFRKFVRWHDFSSFISWNCNRFSSSKHLFFRRILRLYVQWPQGWVLNTKIYSTQS